MPNRFSCAFLLFVMAFLVSMISSCATVHEEKPVRVEEKVEDTRVILVFTERDSHLIREYYRKHLKRLPPGLAKRKNLPPGLEKQIHRNGTLPPGLSGKPLPSRLEEKLAPLPGGYIRIRVDADVVLLDSRTRMVMDVIYDVAD